MCSRAILGSEHSPFRRLRTSGGCSAHFGGGPFGAIGPRPPIRETLYLTFCAFGGLWIAVPFYWRRKPEELKRLTLVVPLFLVAVFVLGNLNEKRIYSELTPIVVAHAVVALYCAAIEEHPRR
jgi:preprotein translocase subunit SecG